MLKLVDLNIDYMVDLDSRGEEVGTLESPFDSLIGKDTPTILSLLREIAKAKSIQLRRLSNEEVK